MAGLPLIVSGRCNFNEYVTQRISKTKYMES